VSDRAGGRAWRLTSGRAAALVGRHRRKDHRGSWTSPSTPTPEAGGRTRSRPYGGRSPVPDYCLWLRLDLGGHRHISCRRTRACVDTTTTVECGLWTVLICMGSSILAQLPKWPILAGQYREEPTRPDSNGKDIELVLVNGSKLFRLQLQ
jgi:hypothetical protein